MTNKEIQFEDLIGNTYGFYGVDNQCFKLGCHIFEVLEDESDGYRSYLKSVHIREQGNLVFSRLPIAYVKVETAPDNPKSDGKEIFWYENDFQGYQLKCDNHIWLLIGTRNALEYYPCFTFMYNPLVD